MSLYGLGYGSFGNGIRNAVVGSVVGFIVTIVLVVLLYMFVLPKDKRESLNPFLKIVHDILNLKGLLIETVLRFLYVFISVYFVVMGIVTFFTSPIAGLGMLIFAPIITRLIFEGMMLVILLVKNVIEINNKLKGNGSNAQETIQFGLSEAVEVPKTEKKSEEEQSSANIFSAMTQQAQNNSEEAKKVCPNCGAEEEADSAFCTRCGTKLND